jgi:hypothetical protein
MPSMTTPAMIWRRERPDWLSGSHLKLLGAYAEPGDGYGIDATILGDPSGHWWRWRVYYHGTMIGTAGRGEAQPLKEAVQAAEVVVADIRLTLGLTDSFARRRSSKNGWGSTTASRQRTRSSPGSSGSGSASLPPRRTTT